MWAVSACLTYGAYGTGISLGPVSFIWSLWGFGCCRIADKKKDLRQKFSMRDYLTEMEIPAGSDLAGGSAHHGCRNLFELEMDILDLRREGQLPCSFGRFFCSRPAMC